LPETGQRRFGPVGRRVDRDVTETLRELEEQRRLADLPRTGEELDSSGCVLGKAPLEKVATTEEVEAGTLVHHSRIIIRLCMVYASRVGTARCATRLAAAFSVSRCSRRTQRRSVSSCRRR